MLRNDSSANYIHAERNADDDGIANVNIYCDCIAHRDYARNCNVYCDCITDRDGNDDPDCNIYGNRDCAGNSNVDRDGNLNLDTNANAFTDRNCYFDDYTNADVGELHGAGCERRV